MQLSKVEPGERIQEGGGDALLQGDLAQGLPSQGEGDAEGRQNPQHRQLHPPTD